MLEALWLKTHKSHNSLKQIITSDNEMKVLTQFDTFRSSNQLWVEILLQLRFVLDLTYKK